MIKAEPDWLDLRAPYDDAARQEALPLLDRVGRALTGGSPRPLVVIDIGAGTGHSMRWFDRQLTQRLPGRSLHRVLVDADQAALDIAARRCGPLVRTVAAPITSLPEVAAASLAEVSLTPTQPGNLLITGSALLDVLTRDDLAAIIETLDRCRGIGIFLLSTSGPWQISPRHPDDAVLDEAFRRHQCRGSRLGTTAAEALEEETRRTGMRVETSVSSWYLHTPRDRELLARFLTDRVGAAIDENPRLAASGSAWLAHRLAGGAELDVVVDHTDVLITPTALDGESAPEVNP